MRAVAYIRVSSLSQVEGHSLDAQERLFYELCKNRGWEPVSIYREEGKSAHVEAIARRPVFRNFWMMPPRMNSTSSSSILSTAGPETSKSRWNL